MRLNKLLCKLFGHKYNTESIVTIECNLTHDVTLHAIVCSRCRKAELVTVQEDGPIGFPLVVHGAESEQLTDTLRRGVETSLAVGDAIKYITVTRRTIR